MRRSIAVLGASLGFACFAPPAGAAEPLLPDLTQETPYALGIVTDGTRYHLGFASVVYNYGDGPLRIVGSRESRDDPAMTAAQVIDQDDGTKSRVEGIGRLRYVDAITHRHWHYLKFDTYSLRRPDGTLARPDQKTGFCLGDRLVAPEKGPLPAMGAFGEYGGNCGFDEPDLMRVDEGISVGFGDDYGPQLEGQFVDITRLPAGRYVLVHRVNADGALQEKSLQNNASSVLVDVRWPGRAGAPRVTQVARCPLSASCPVAPALTRRRAVRLARDALRRAFGRDAAQVACDAPADGGATCHGTVAGGGGSAVVELRYLVAHGRLYWTYAASGADAGDAGGAKRGRIAVDLGRGKRVPVDRQGFPPRGARAARAARVAYCPLIARG